MDQDLSVRFGSVVYSLGGQSDSVVETRIEDCRIFNVVGEAV